MSPYSSLITRFVRFVMAPLPGLLALPALAQEVATSATVPSSSGGYTFISALMLILLALAVAVLAWLMRRGVGAASGGSSMKVVAVQPLGQRERLVVVNVGGRYFLLGHTTSQISMLTELAPEDVPRVASVIPANLFADLLGRFKK